MNKTIQITGKTNIDKILHKKPQDRLITKKWVYKDKLSHKHMHKQFLNNIKNNKHFNGVKSILYEISNKHKSYAEQDIKMARYDPNLLISKDSIIGTSSGLVGT